MRVLVIAIATAVTVAVAVLVYATLSITVSHYPSCITYAADGGMVMPETLRKRVYDIGLPLIAESENSLRFESNEASLTWSGDQQLVIHVCTKAESKSTAWLEIAGEIQPYLLTLPGIEGHVRLNSEEPMCGLKTDNQLAMPIDFSDLKKTLACKFR